MSGVNVTPNAFGNEGHLYRPGEVRGLGLGHMISVLSSHVDLPGCQSTESENSAVGCEWQSSQGRRKTVNRS